MRPTPRLDLYIYPPTLVTLLTDCITSIIFWIRLRAKIQNPKSKIRNRCEACSAGPRTPSLEQVRGPSITPLPVIGFEGELLHVRVVCVCRHIEIRPCSKSPVRI